MGIGRSKNRHHEDEGRMEARHEEPFVPVCDLAISDGDISRLWSYNSVSGGRYVYLTDKSVPGDSDSYFVEATGEAGGLTEPLTDISFYVKEAAPLKFELKFHKDNSAYSVIASKDMVTASSGDSKTTLFRVLELLSPNEPYFVLRSDKDNEELYLSSDGAGNLKLKPLNKPAPQPPDTSAGVDPALLFRLLEPKRRPAKEN